jgi:hypothetical protein
MLLSNFNSDFLLLVEHNYFEIMGDILANWAFPWPNDANGIPVVVPDVIFVINFFKALSDCARKLKLQMTLPGQIDWLALSAFFALARPVGNVPTIVFANHGREYVDNLISDIHIFVALFVTFGAPFVPEALTTTIPYGFRGICVAQSNLSMPTCKFVVEKWRELGQNGYRGVGYTGMGNIRMNFVPLPSIIPDVSFLPPLIPPLFPLVPIPLPYTAVTPVGLPTAAETNIAATLQRVYNSGHLNAANVTRNVQFAFEVSDNVIRRCRVLVDPI